ncbi:MAG: alpha/beta hydrolase family protein [Acidimicrobiales bacterium]|jgi:predicted alpha/beta-hydrolase family hydrolase
MTAPAGFLLTHGAGSDRNHRLSLAIEQRLELPVRRMDFPYRKAGRKGPPDRAPKLIAEVVREAEEFAAELGVGCDRLVLGGRSMGGRMCSMAVAEGLPALGLVLLSYPLHPPNKPEKLRIEHFPKIEIPSIFVNGDRDPFGTPEEMKRELNAIPGAVTIHWLDAQRHDPKPTFDTEIIEVVGRFVDSL